MQRTLLDLLEALRAPESPPPLFEDPATHLVPSEGTKLLGDIAWAMKSAPERRCGEATCVLGNVAIDEKRRAMGDSIRVTTGGYMGLSICED